MGSAVLGEAISAIRDWSATQHKASARLKAADTFGSLVFNDVVQEKRLPKAVYQALQRTIAHGESLDPTVAGSGSSPPPRSPWAGRNDRCCCWRSICPGTGTTSAS